MDLEETTYLDHMSNLETNVNNPCIGKGKLIVHQTEMVYGPPLLLVDSYFLPSGSIEAILCYHA